MKLSGLVLLLGAACAEDVELEAALKQRIALGAVTVDHDAGRAAVHVSSEVEFAEELTPVPDDQSAVLSIEAEPGIPARIVFADDIAPMQIIKKHGEATLWIEGGTLVAKGVDVADCRNTVAERDATIIKQQAAISKAISEIEGHKATIEYLKTFTRQRYCVHGVALEGPACNPDRGHRCATCHAGYHLGATNGECVLNTCACFHGFGSTGAQCAEHGTPHCKACEAGYELAGSACQYKAPGNVKK